MNNKTNKLKDLFYRLKSSRYFIPGLVIIILIVIFIVLLFLSSNDIFTSNLEEIEGDLPEKIYVDELYNFNIEIFGTGNLQNTVVSYKVYPSQIVYLSNESLMGSKVTNQLLGLKTGEFTIEISAKLGLKKLELDKKKIVVCKKLSLASLTSDEYDFVINKESAFKINLGTPTICNSGITYLSEDNSIASVSTDGKIYGKKLGRTNLVLQQDNLTINVPINIVKESEKVTGVKFNSYNYTISVGETYKLIAMVLPTTAKNKDVTWVSSDSNIATVNTSGLVTGVSSGKTQIIVKTKSSGYTSSVTITVK